MHRLTGELHGVHLQLIRGKGAGGDGWAGILGQCKGPCVPKLDGGICSRQSPRPKKKMFIQYSACVVPPAGEVSVTSGPGLATRGFQHVFPPQMPPFCHSTSRLSGNAPSSRKPLLAPPDVQSLSVSLCVTDVDFDQTTRVRLHVCLQKRQLIH